FKHKKVIHLTLKTLIRLPLLFLVYMVIAKFTPINFYIQGAILSKFDNKSADLLDGRGSVWKQTLSDASLFGNGESYFIDNVGLGAHNTFIHILGVYGWVPMIIFCLFFAVSLHYCIRFILFSK